MSDKDYLKDISEIKDLMNKSSRFISLSGLSGILAGVYALIGSYFANRIIQNTRGTENSYEQFAVAFNVIQSLFLIAFTVIFLATTTGIILTYKKAKSKGEKFWGTSSRRLLFL